MESKLVLNVVPEMTYLVNAELKGEKGRDLTQSCDKNPYTHSTIQKATWQHKYATKKVWLHNYCGPTKDGQLE